MILINFFQSFMSGIAFLASTYLELPVLLGILVFFNTIGFACYAYVEIKENKRPYVAVPSS